MTRRRTVLTGAAGLAGGVLGGGGLIGGAIRQSRADGTIEPGTRAFEPLGRLRIDGIAEAVVGPDGETVYASLPEGFAVVDVSDPANPTELARVTGILDDQTPGVQGITDVKVSGDRLLVGGPGTFGDIQGFEVYDVSDPADPSRVTGTMTSHGMHNGFLDGDVAYLTGSGLSESPVVIYDVSGDRPEELARWSVTGAGYDEVNRNNRTCHDVYVQNEVAYVAFWDAGAWLLDVSDPAVPEPIAQVGGVPPDVLPTATGGLSPSVLELPGNAHYVQPNATGDLLAVGKEAWDQDETDRDGGPGGIELWDVADPSNAERLTILAAPALGHTAHNLGWRGDRLYTSWYGGGVKVYDVSSPAEPTVIAKWRDIDKTSFWTAKPAAGSVVASSTVDPSLPEEERENGGGAAVYTFPEPSPDATGTPAETATPRPTTTPTTSTTTRRTTTTTTRQPTTATTTPPTTTSPTTTSPTTSPPTTDGKTTTDDGDGDGGQGLPGFGVLTALAAGGLAGWRLLRSGDGEE